MAQFAYKARRRTGEVVEGVLEGTDRSAALMQIERLGLFPVSVDAAKGAAVAAALGAEIIPEGAPQFGFIDVEALPAAREDPLARETTPGLPLLHWHADAMALPPGATLLLRCERGRVQAFRAGTLTYAFLAPLLIDAATIRRWAAERARAKNNPAFAIRLSGEIERHQRRAELVAAAILAGWLELTAASR